MRQVIHSMAYHLFDLQIAELTELPNEHQRVETRQADMVLRATSPEGCPFILHLELQNTNQRQMPLRMMRYYTDIALAHPDLLIHQYLVYTGAARLQMPDRINHPDWRYIYHVIDMSQLDYAEFIRADNPGALVLAVLCDFKGNPAEVILARIIQRLIQQLADTPDHLTDHLGMLELLAVNRNLQVLFKTLEADMLSSITVEQMPSYEIGMERGMERGMAQAQHARQEGMQQGIRKGREEAAYKIAQRLLQQGYPPGMVMETTGLSPADLPDH